MTLPLAFDAAEQRYAFEPVDASTPETVYERRWALTLIERVLAQLRHEWQGAGRTAEFEALKRSLLHGPPPGGYAGVADRLGTTEGAVKVAVHRLRRTFQARLREHIAETIADPSEVDDELRFLIRAVDA